MAAKTQKNKEGQIVSEASLTVDLKTGQMTFDPVEGKNPAAMALGRLGGLKGGVARAKKLSSKRKREIAIKAATVRWEIKGCGKKKKDSERP